MKNTFFEVSVESSQNGTEKDSYFSAFRKSGIKKKDIAELRSEEKLKLAVYLPNRISALQLKSKLRIFTKKQKPRINISKLTPSDWLTRWEKESRPFNIAENFCVVPDGVKEKYKKKPGRIIIDSAMAFGLGQHPTTQAMAGFIEKKAKVCKSMLDVGTGTGILSIVAKKSGIKDIWCSDISADAISSAKKNMRSNGCRVQKFLTGDFNKMCINRTFDMVCANILARNIIGMKKRLVAATGRGGYLALSGIWKDDYEKLLENFKKKELSVRKVISKKGWYSVLLQKAAN